MSEKKLLSLLLENVLGVNASYMLCPELLMLHNHNDNILENFAKHYFNLEFSHTLLSCVSYFAHEL